MPPMPPTSSTRAKLEPLLSKKEFAGLIGVSTKTVGRWIKSGDLHASLLGGQWRIEQDDARSFIAQRRR